MNKKKLEWEVISNFSESEQSLGFLLWKISTEWRRMIEEALRPTGITHTQFVLLASIGYLATRSTSVSQVELAEHAQLHIAMTSQVLKTLEQKGLIRRLRKKQDDRAKCASLTPEGAALVEQAIPLVEDIDNLFFKRLTPQDQTTFLAIMQKLAHESAV